MDITAKITLTVNIPDYFFKMVGIKKKKLSELTERQKKELFKSAFYESSEPAGELYNLSNDKIELL